MNIINEVMNIISVRFSHYSEFFFEEWERKRFILWKVKLGL